MTREEIKKVFLDAGFEDHGNDRLSYMDGIVVTFGPHSFALIMGGKDHVEQLTYKGVESIKFVAPHCFLLDSRGGLRTTYVITEGAVKAYSKLYRAKEEKHE